MSWRRDAAIATGLSSIAMEIRRLVPADAAAHRALMLDAYQLHVDAFTASVDERAGLPLSWWESRIANDDAADELVFGAWIEDRLVGVAGLRRETRPKSRHKATLVGMYVDAVSAKRGVGRRLVDAVLDAARACEGLRVVQLTVTEGNRAAEALYRRCGFVPFGIEPCAMLADDGYRSKVHMWLDLAAVGNIAARSDEATSDA